MRGLRDEFINWVVTSSTLFSHHSNLQTHQPARAWASWSRAILEDILHNKCGVTDVNVPSKIRVCLITAWRSRSILEDVFHYVADVTYIDFAATISVTIPDILDHKGIHYRGRRCKCPIHDGNNPTAFSFTDDVFNCFVCGASGGKLDLVTALYETSRYEAMQILSQINGESLSSHCHALKRENTLSRGLSHSDKNRRWLRETLKTISFVQGVLTRMLVKTRRDAERGIISAIDGITDAQIFEYQLERYDELHLDKKIQLRRLEVKG